MTSHVGYLGRVFNEIGGTIRLPTSGKKPRFLFQSRAIQKIRQVDLLRSLIVTADVIAVRPP
jgi:hypothetical protein